MLTNNKNNDAESHCMRTQSLGTKFMFFILGGGVGAVIALLFAPKPGKELRQDIADAAVRGCNETLEAAARVREQTAEYYDAAKEKGVQVLDTVSANLTAFKEEITDDVTKIGGMAEGAARHVRDSIKAKTVG